MKFRNVTKLQLAFADYEATLEDFDRMQFGMPHAKHEAAERSDAFASRQYALKAMDVIDKQKEKKCLKELYNEGMLSAHDYTEAIIESGSIMDRTTLKNKLNFYERNKKFLEQQKRKEHIHNLTCNNAIKHIDYILNKYDLPKEIKQLGLKEQLTTILAYVLEKEDLEKTISCLESIDKF